MSKILIGHGMEIVAIDDIKSFLEQVGEDFVMEYFTASERRAAESGVNRIQYFASRFCAKKAVLKALGLELQENSFWLEIEVQKLPTGEPSVVLNGKCREIADRLRLTKLLLSISHVSAYAGASAIAISKSSQALVLS
ncbi:4'-phosphopantetheinyl transferase superfamily protein [Nostoc sp. CHAB 5834]|nr:4'-phosphopantetheinyl transferase superfamily protein [Nostoc sp. CHAB 5834]